MADEHSAIDWLLASDEPAVRYRARTWLLDQPETDPAVIADRAAIPTGAVVSTLLDFPDPTLSPYRKWFGLHWRLVSLADFDLPTDAATVRATLDEGIDRELTWITNPRHLESIKQLDDGLYRADASIEGNALYAASRVSARHRRPKGCPGQDGARAQAEPAGGGAGRSPFRLDSTAPS